MEHARLDRKALLGRNRACLSTFGLQHFLQSWQFLKKEVWNKGYPRYDTIATELPSAPIKSFVSGFNKVRADKPEIEPKEIDNFSLFCRRFLKPGGSPVLLAELFMIDILH